MKAGVGKKGGYFGGGLLQTRREVCSRCFGV